VDVFGCFLWLMAWDDLECTRLIRVLARCNNFCRKLHCAYGGFFLALVTTRHRR